MTQANIIKAYFQKHNAKKLWGLFQQRCQAFAYVPNDQFEP